MLRLNLEGWAGVFIPEETQKNFKKTIKTFKNQRKTNVAKAPGLDHEPQPERTYIGGQWGACRAHGPHPRPWVDTCWLHGGTMAVPWRGPQEGPIKGPPQGPRGPNRHTWTWFMPDFMILHDFPTICLCVRNTGTSPWLGWLACCALPWLGLAWACLAGPTCLALDRCGNRPPSAMYARVCNGVL